MSDIILTDQNFEKQVLKSDTPVLVDFWAEWCQPCKIVDPVIHELAEEYVGKLKVGKLNVDDFSATAQQYGIMSIPSLLIFKGGQVVEQFTGVQTKDKLKSALGKHAA